MDRVGNSWCMRWSLCAYIVECCLLWQGEDKVLWKINIGFASSFSSNSWILYICDSVLCSLGLLLYVEDVGSFGFNKTVGETRRSLWLYSVRRVDWFWVMRKKRKEKKHPIHTKDKECISNWSFLCSCCGKWLWLVAEDWQNNLHGLSVFLWKNGQLQDALWKAGRSVMVLSNSCC